MIKCKIKVIDLTELVVVLTGLSLHTHISFREVESLRAVKIYQYLKHMIVL